MIVRFCELDEVDKLQAFIRSEWSADHILVHSINLLNYQHRNVEQKRYNFVLSTDEKGEIQAVLGFIPPEHFQANDDVIWLALWKTASSCKEKTIGLLLLRFLEKHYAHAAIRTVGISAQARLIYKALRYNILQLRQYYLAISDQPGKIAIGLQPANKSVEENQYALLEGVLSHFQQNTSSKYRPRSSEYFQVKYKNHPIYAYECVCSEQADLTIVYRIVEIPEGKVMRIIDCAGNLQAFPKIVQALVARAKAAEVEYIDILAYWADCQPLIDAGFRPVAGEIVPNYFEPFVQKNVQIECAVKNEAMSDLVIMKGDGDQDRPSRIKGGNL